MDDDLPDSLRHLFNALDFKLDHEGLDVEGKINFGLTYAYSLLLMHYQDDEIRDYVQRTLNLSMDIVKKGEQNNGRA
jgi:hypothetical protein